MEEVRSPLNSILMNLNFFLTGEQLPTYVCITSWNVRSNIKHYMFAAAYLQFPQVAPVKLVWEQSQMYRFHPSVQLPPCIQGLSWQYPIIL